LPGIDERLTRELERLGEVGAGGSDPERAFDRIAAKKVRRRLARRVEAASLVIVVLAATAAGSYGLVKVLGLGKAGSHPAGSTEGPINRKIAFVRSSEVANAQTVAAVYAINQDRTGLQKLTPDEESIADLAWSPDGTRLAMVASQGSNGTSNGYPQIYVMNADGSDLTQLTRDPSSQYLDPAWSPDGTRIVFARWSDDGISSGLYLISADGDGETRVTDSAALDSSPSWFPDGSALLFKRDIEGQTQLMVVKTNGTGERPVPLSVFAGHALDIPAAGYVGSAALSPDGAKILLTRLDPSFGQKNFDIFVANLDGTGEARLTRTAVPEGEAAWSPDVKQIAFSREGDIYAMRGDGTDLRQLTDTGNDSWPAWQRAPEAGPTVVTPTAVTPAPSAVPSPSASLGTDACTAQESAATGDFDGDGMKDTAVIGPSSCFEQRTPITTPWALQLKSGNGAGLWPMPECSAESCRVLGAGDVNGDGVDELAVAVEQGASTQFVEFFEVPLGPNGPQPVVVSPPGADGFPSGEPAKFPYGGSVTHYAALGCGELDVVSEVATLNADQTEWAVHVTNLHLDATGPSPRFTVVSTDDSTQKFDPDVGVGDIFEPGGPCWTEPGV
jgi:Tol biopolymer transport system component